MEHKNDEIRAKIQSIQQQADEAFKATTTIRTDFDEECQNYT